MPYNEEFRWEDAVRKTETFTRGGLRELFAGEEAYQDLLQAQGSLTNLAWGRILFNLVDTKTTTLTINATAKTIRCLPGAGLFANAKVGRKLQITNFSVNPTNNQTTLITKWVSADELEITEATSLVDETDINARAQENTLAHEDSMVTALKATALAAHQLYTDFIGGTPTTSNKAALYRDFA